MARVDQTHGVHPGAAAPLHETQRLARLEQLLAQETAARIQAEQERQIFSAVVQSCEDLVAMTDLDGQMLFLNEAGRKLLGLAPNENLADKTLAELLPADEARRWNDVELPALRSSGRWSGAGQLWNAQTACRLELQIQSFRIVDPQSQQPLCLATVRHDVTERMGIEESARLSEERFRHLSDNIEVVFWISSPDLRTLYYLSPACEKIWGRPPESFSGKPLFFLRDVLPEDRHRLLEGIAKLTEENYQEVFRINHPNGSIRTMRARAFRVRNDRGEVHRVAGLIEDVTEAKQIEEELLAEQRFLEHLLHAQEGERSLVAYDIHDGFLQCVIAALMYIEGLGADPQVLDVTREKLEKPLALLRNSIEEARRMISGLRPPIIDEQGLVAAIDYLINETSAAKPLKILFHHAVHFERLEPVLEGTLFRIVQEALTNVLRHSQALVAQITLIQSADRLGLVIEDWGVGFDAKNTPGRQFGLRGIRERCRLFGGTALIHSVPGQGTRISVELPLKGAFSRE